MGSIRKSTEIGAPPEAVVAILLDVASYPQWQDEIERTEVLEHDDQGRAATVRMFVKAMGRTMNYVVAYRYPDPGTVAFELVEADVLSRNDVTYSVSPSGDGTCFTVEIDVAPKLKLPRMVVNQLSQKAVKETLSGVKQRAESR